jgi:uncharacterized membrane protein YbhN (UPF0104 family)
MLKGTEKVLKEFTHFSKIIGIILTVLSIFFILRKIFALKINFEVLFSFKSVLVLTAVIFVQILIHHLAAYMWYLLLCFTSGCKLVLEPVFNVFFKCIPQRYIPGNMMHYIGRNILGVGLKVKQSSIALSSVMEITFYIISCILLSLMLGGTGTFLLLKKYFFLNKNVLIIAIFLLVILILLFLIIFRLKIVNLFKGLKYIHFKNMINCFAKYFLVHLFVFLISGLLLFIMMGLYSEKITGIFMIISAFTIATLIGTVTPGAPGGIGIREAVLVLLLGPVYGESVVIQGAIMQRFALVIADLLVFPVFKFVTYRICRKY